MMINKTIKMANELSTKKKTLLVILFVTSIIFIIFAYTGKRPECIKGNIGRQNLPHGWYQKGHPWKKNTYCRYSGKGTDAELEEDGNFFCFHGGKPYVHASTLGISPDDPHDVVEDNPPEKCV